jgi:RNA polymerase sigma factor (sigma-70 family)
VRTASRDLQLLFSEGTLHGLSDGRLLERFGTHREEEAFEALVRRHGPMVWGVCRRVLRNHHDAEDAFQATFLVLARKGDAIAHRELVANWLYGVAHQTAMKARSTRTKRQMREGQVTDMPEPEAGSEHFPDDLTESLDRELSRLPDKYRIPIVLCELEGKSHRAAAEELGWPIGTVSGRLSRARAMLAKRLVRQGVALSVGSLEVLLAQESASAGMPATLIGSTARAASLFAAGGAITVGAVPAQVAALTGAVMKTMLLSKLKMTTAMFLAASVLVAGGTGLNYRAWATESTTQEAKPAEPEKPAEAKPAEPARAEEAKTAEPARREEAKPADPAELEEPKPVERARSKEEPGATSGERRLSDAILGTTDRRRSSHDMPETDLPLNEAPVDKEPQDPAPPDQEQPAEDLLADHIMAVAHTSEQLQRAKMLIESMLALEKETQNKSPAELTTMIQERTNELAEERWVVRVLEAQVRRLMKIRETAQVGTPRREGPAPVGAAPAGAVAPARKRIAPANDDSAPIRRGFTGAN